MSETYPFIPDWRLDDDYERDTWEIGWRAAIWFREDPLDVLETLKEVA